MYVYDNVGVIIDLMVDDKVVNEIYNIGSGVHHTNMEIIDMIGNILGEEVKIKHVPDRLGHDRKYSLHRLKLLSYYRSKDISFECLDLQEFLLNLYKK